LYNFFSTLSFLVQIPSYFLKNYSMEDQERGIGYQQSETHVTINTEMPPPTYDAQTEIMVPNPPPNPAPIMHHSINNN
jgi:hypothetical protein